MDIELNVLNKITETAVKAACIRDYNISPLKKRCIDPEGNVRDTDIDPPPHQNTLLDFASCVEVFKQHKTDGAEIFVDSERITVAHDSTLTKGQSVCPLQKSATIEKIYECEGENHSPEEFEKIAKLYFGADSQFINRIRKLQWQAKTDTTARLSSVSKSADIQAIAKVVDENEILFQDISLLVKAPYYVLPHKTTEIEIELHIIACAETRTISFAPLPDVLALAEFDAIHEVCDLIDSYLIEAKIDAEVIFGCPGLKAS